MMTYKHLGSLTCPYKVLVLLPGRICRSPRQHTLLIRAHVLLSLVQRRSELTPRSATLRLCKRRHFCSRNARTEKLQPEVRMHSPAFPFRTQGQRRNSVFESDNTPVYRHRATAQMSG